MANYQTPGVLCAQRGGHMTSDGSMMCGPGAPVCVTIGAVVGGALAAFGVDYFHLW